MTTVQIEAARILAAHGHVSMLLAAHRLLVLACLLAFAAAFSGNVRLGKLRRPPSTTSAMRLQLLHQLSPACLQATFSAGDRGTWACHRRRSAPNIATVSMNMVRRGTVWYMHALLHSSEHTGDHTWHAVQHQFDAAATCGQCILVAGNGFGRGKMPIWLTPQPFAINGLFTDGKRPPAGKSWRPDSHLS